MADDLLLLPAKGGKSEHGIEHGKRVTGAARLVIES
jgi:hypothetical protein